MDTKAKRIYELEDRKIRDEIDLKAMEGDPIAMVAHALLRVADAQSQAARALDKLGFNDMAQPKGAPGTTEKIAMELADISIALGGIASALEGMARDD